MINRSGLFGAVHNLKPVNSNGKNQSSTSAWVIGRVVDIVLDENHPRFTEVGEWNGIGTVFIEIVNSSNSGTINFAKPLYPNIKSYPIINELVSCFNSPTPTSNSKTYKHQYYYSNILSLWNHPHHNASPNPRIFDNSTESKIDYQQVEGGAVKRTTDTQTEINLNSPSNPSQNTFVEKTNIHPLMPFMGDSMYEGRFGNSIRLGSTSKSNSIYKNNWSKEGENGDPITILRNGQPTNTSNEGWIPLTEDMNKDLSSIYLTSTQKLPIEQPLEGKFNMFTPNSRPLTPSSFKLPQILLNSDRILINAKKDSVLIGAEKSINLSANEYVNINSSNLYVDDKNVKLGSIDATEPILLGDKTAILLNRLITQLNSIFTILQSDQTYTGGTPVLNAPMNAAAINALSVLSDLQSQLTSPAGQGDSIKSKISKTL